MLEVEEQRSLPTSPDVEYRRALRADLDRRVTELAATPDEAFGRLGVADAVLVLVLFVVIPALAVWIWR